jgi:branched-chain amino acid aminotransferase
MNIPVLDAQDWLSQMNEKRATLSSKFYAMYSSVVGGIITDPALMAVPMDDHLVHRGDGIFESFKCVDGQIYNLGAHLDRLDRSCARVALTVPVNRAELREIIIQTVRAGGVRKCLVRLLVSRGTGTMGVNPYECQRPEIYVMVYEMNDKPAHNYEEGVSVRLSDIPVKPSFFATVKSCNYLPNVLMKKEAVDWDVDFVISVDENGNLGEGATENIGFVTQDNELLMPPAERVLAGTTVERVFRLAEEILKPAGLLKHVAYENISVEQAKKVKEMLIIGTTPDVVPVVQFEGQPVAGGKPGPIFKALLDALRKDIRENPARLTQVFEEV